MGLAKHSQGAPVSVVDLVYELLDAHDDTARLVQATSCEDAWAAHLDYLRRLQRIGRETLAQAAHDG